MGRGCEEAILLLFERVADPVHLVRDFVGRVARDVLVEGGGIHIAPRPAGALGEKLGPREDVVRDRNCGFHTGSVNAVACC